ncbi:multidrug effflux MFS transporter [Halomonas elongata]|uniref:multidrug effflux MFS transporter n=1 Tax=Halomonas elongata TaxID=2746 RepID=UPI00186B9887|nr:multidrug effflux MFS transporter [Halomonas elongata]MBW5801513.1 multidrug effflux MFS transporter [Halomonas elongata]MDL4862991.1 multidrug effflux MFS transporter [Halomonas elongata]
MSRLSRSSPAVWLLAALVTLPQIGETIYTPALTDLARDLAISQGQAQSTLSIFFIAFAIGVLSWGRLCDRWGRRPTLLLALGVYLAGSLLCLSATTIEPLLAGRAIQAFGAAACSVVIQAICREAFAGQTRMRVFATIGMIIPVSTAMGPFIGGGVAALWGWRATFGALCLLGLGLLTACWRELPETSSTPGAPPLLPLMGRMLCDPFVLGMATLIGVANGIVFAYHAEAPFLLIDHWGLNSATYGALGMGVVGGSITGGALLRRLNHRHWTSHACIALGLSTMLSAILGLWATAPLTGQAGYRPGLMLFLGCASLLFAGYTITCSTCLHQALADYQEALGSAGALLGLTYYVIVAAITQGMALLHDGSPDTLPRYALALLMLAGLAYLRLVKPRLCRS